MYRRCTLLRMCSSTTMRADCTMITRCGSKSWRRMRLPAIAGLETGCTTAPAKLASGKPLSRGNRGNNADAHLKRRGPPSEAVVVAVTNGRLDGFAEGSPKSLAPGSGSWGVSWMADTGISTGGAGSGCWSRSSGSRCALCYPDINRRRSLCLMSILARGSKMG